MKIWGNKYQKTIHKGFCITGKEQVVLFLKSQQGNEYEDQKFIETIAEEGMNENEYFHSKRNATNTL